MPARSVDTVTNDRISFPFMIEQHSIVRAYAFLHLIYPLIFKQLGYYYILLLRIMQWLWECRYLFKMLFSFLLVIYPEGEFFFGDGHRLDLCRSFRDPLHVIVHSGYKNVYPIPRAQRDPFPAFNISFGQKAMNSRTQPQKLHRGDRKIAQQ